MPHRDAYALALHQRADLALRIADEHRRSTGGEDAVELAREHVAFGFRPLRHQMQVADAEAEGRCLDKVGPRREVQFLSSKVLLEALHIELKTRLIVRASGTEPVIRVMAEGDDRELVATIVDQVVDALTEAEV